MVYRILFWYIGISATLVLVIQCLSLFHAVAPLPLTISMGVVGIAVALRGWRRFRRCRIRFISLSHLFNPLPLTIPMLVALPIIAGISLVLGWHVPPNNWDAMAYHLSRAAYWRQWHTLAHFPTYKWNQNANPGNAEVLLLVTLLLTHTDTLAFLVQFSAYVATTLAVYGLGRQLSLKPAYALIGAGMFATMPEVILQSTSTQNDLTATAFTMCAVYFLLNAIQQRKKTSLIIMGVALGLAIGAKPTAFFALPGLGIGAAVLLWRQHTWQATRQGVVAAVAALLLLLTLGAPWYIADKTDYGSFTGPTVVSQLEKVPTPSLTTLRVNTLRYIVGLVDPEGPLLLTQAASATCGRTATLRAVLDSTLHLPTSAQGTQVDGTFYTPAPSCSFNEDLSWFGLAGLLATFVALTIALVAPFTRRIGVAWMLAAGVTSYLLLFSLSLRWSPFQQRLLITMVALAAPLLGLLVQRLWEWRLGRPLAQLVVLYTALTGLAAATNNGAKPLAAWAASRATMQVVMRPDMGPVFHHVAQSIPTIARVGTLLDDGDWDYPLFGQHLDRTIEPLIPSANASAYAIQPAKLDYVLTHQPKDEVYHLFKEWHMDGCHEVWAVGVTDSTVPWTLYRCAPRLAQS